jgi:hypothetical protein
MTSRQEIFANGVVESRELLRRYLKGFDDSNHTKQATNLPNHVAWTLGHVSLVMNRVAEKLDGQPLPPESFVKGDGTAGDRERYDTESVSFNSKPVDDPSRYPTLPRCVQIFDAAVERLASALRRATDAQLDSPTRWGAGETTLGNLAIRMVFHNGTHSGQLADLRRALKMGSIFG